MRRSYQPQRFPVTYSSRFFLYAPFGLLLLAALAMGARWWVVAGRLETRLDAMQRGEAMPGITVHYGKRSVGGFPFRLEALLDDLSVRVETASGPAVWHAEHFALHGLTYGRDELIFEAAGRQSLSWGHGHRLDFQTGSLHASAIRDAGGLARFDLDLVAFDSPALAAGRIQFHIRQAKTALDIAASGEDVQLAPGQRGAFGDHISLVALQGDVSAPRAFDGLRAGRTDWRSALEAWRKAGGALHANPLEFHFSTLDMLAHGRIGLDEARRVSGLLDVKVTGMPDWLAHAPQSRPGGFAAALRDRALKAGADQAGKMGVVLGARDGIVYLGDQPVGVVGPVY
jgi:hypothetical protein